MSSMNTSGSRWSPFGRALLAMLAALSVVLFIACDAPSRIAGLRPSAPAFNISGTGVVISQVYGGGGNSGSTYKNDFIELYNPGPTDVSVAGWTVQYASAAGTSWATTTLTGSIPSGGYYLVQEGAGTGGTTALPKPDATGTIAMSATAGKVALVSNATALSGACPTGAVDFVGFGGAGCFEGTGPTAAPSNTNAVLRTDGKDTDVNSADFIVGAPNPRNTSNATPIASLTATVAPLARTLEIGGTMTFSALAVRGSQPVVVTSSEWTSGDPTVATIDHTTGQATAVAPGGTTITVTVTTPAGMASASATLIVAAPLRPILITQVYGGGGNNGSTLKNDFVELYNAGTTDVDLKGWSVQYGSASGTNWTAANKTDLSGVIHPGHYFLIKEAAGTNGSVDLPPADVTGSIAVGGTTGTIALARTVGLLNTAACAPNDEYVVDFVGYGSTCFRGSPTPALSASTAAMRGSCRLADPSSNTNNNRADFRVVEPVPHNGTQTPPPPGDAATITVSPDIWSLRLGQTKEFATAILGTDNSPVCAPITWSSSNPAIAPVVADSGVVTAKALGTATITATALNGVTGVATVSVIVGNVTVQPRPAPLPKGFQSQLFLNNGATDSNNNPVKNSDISWSSSNPGVVGVNATTGVITARSLGSAIITGLSRTDGLSSGSTTITVNEPVTAAGARIGHNTELGIPTDADASDDKLIVRRQYTTSYNPRRGVTNWVSWNLDASHSAGGARCDCMTADTALVRLGLPAYDTNDWINNGSNGAYSRGHMSPSADWNVSNGDNAATFFLTNMLPQNQDMNAGPWGALEDTLRMIAREGKELYIVSGGIFTPGFVAGKAEGYGSISNAGKITIPDSIWKIAIIVPDTRAVSGILNASDVQVIAVNTPNKKPESDETWHSYVTTIDKIQKSTGYDFLSALPENVECRLEQRNCGPSAVITGAGLAGGAEGQTLSFSASTSSDTEGDALTYRWDMNGVVAGTDAALNYLFSDDGVYAVRLIVADAGRADTTTTSVNIANVAPSVGTVAPATIDEGGTYTASGSFVDPGDDQWIATVDYGDGSGTQPLTLSGKTFALSHTYAASGSYTVTVTVRETDAEAASGSRIATVSVANVAPVVATFDGATILRGESYAASGTFADPGADTWTATVNYGDGSGAGALALNGQGFALQHSYGAAGVYTVTVTVTDSDGGPGTRTAAVTVLSAGDGIARLASTIAGLASTGAIQDGDAKWLANKLDVAAKELARGNTGPVRNQLQELIARVDAARAAGRLSADTAATLTAYANRLLASM
jgi:DNA/RNA endonuclease G (NUC1)